MVVQRDQRDAPPPSTAAPSKSAPSARMGRRSPCRDSGGDERSRDLAQSIAAHGRAIAASQRALLGEIAKFDRAEAWRGDGAVSMAAWLTERCKVSGGTARTLVQTAAQLESLPHLAAALADGTLSLDAVAPLAEFATPATDPELAAASAHWTVKQIRELAASHRGPTDAAAARQFEQRSLRFNDAKSTIWVAFTKDDYAVAKAALIARDSWTMSDRGGAASGAASGSEERSASGNSSSSPSGATSGADPLGYVPFDQRLYDAFMSICTFGGVTVSSSTSGSSGSGSSGSGSSGTGSPSTGPSGAGNLATTAPVAGAPGPTPAPAPSTEVVPTRQAGTGDRMGGLPGFRPTLVVHADLGLLTGLNPEGVAELAGLGQISREVARRLACDAKVIFSVENKDGCILDQGRVSRSPTAAQRIEIARRDKGCRFSSCGFIDFTQVHHMVP
jgi:hypothetical protein